jgi:hypothetical protein
MDWEAADELCDQLVEHIDELVERDTLNSEGLDFCESARETIVGIQETICRTGRVSLGQERALRNTEGAINKWDH